MDALENSEKYVKIIISVFFFIKRQKRWMVFAVGVFLRLATQVQERVLVRFNMKNAFALQSQSLFGQVMQNCISNSEKQASHKFVPKELPSQRLFQLLDCDAK